MPHRRVNRLIDAAALRVIGWSRDTKRAVALAFDASLCIATVWLAFYMRLNELLVALPAFSIAAAASLVLALPLFVSFGLYRAIFRYSGLPAQLAIGKAIGLYAVGYATVFGAIGISGVPRTVGLLQPMLLLLAVGGSRALARLWLGGLYQQQLRRGRETQHVMVYGAGEAGRQLANAMANSAETKVVGYLDDDPQLQGRILNGLRIYAPEHLPELIEQLDVRCVLLAIPSASRQRRNEILASLAHLHLKVRTLPGLEDLAAGRVELTDLRELDIDDLLGRDPVQPDTRLLQKHIYRQTVLVTGAGGSIGSELCRQILTCEPARLLLFELSEFALYNIHQELIRKRSSSTHLDPDRVEPEIIPLLGSVADAAPVNAVMSAFAPDTVYHAAAYKHVPLVEHNPAEGLRNNVWGTLVCAESARRNAVKQFVLISTDKAVRPTNVMGASKRLAEMVLQAIQSDHNALQHSAEGRRTQFSMVRFGNVLGSSGSVVPRFREQIAAGGPITLTHPDITRYFMTIPEAAQLVIQAGAMGTGGDVFVLDMGESVRIQDLACRMIELSGLAIKDASNPMGDIEIVITGLRPGEKLYEELLIGDNPEPTDHPRIMKTHEEFLPWADLQIELDKVQRALEAHDLVLVRQQLEQLVSGYVPDERIVDWMWLESSRREAESQHAESGAARASEHH